jgi:RNA polymerase sigma-70 factor (ECF subfamily)
VAGERDIETLLAACLRGEAEAWSELVERFAPVILASVRRTFQASRRSADDRDVEDAVQEVFVKLVKNRFRTLRSYDPARSTLRTWLAVVARSVAVDQLRRTRMERVADAPAYVEPETRSATRLEMPRRLLSARQRLVMHLLFDRDMEVADAAALLGIEVQTVRSTKHKALMKLREHFRRRA